MVDAQLSASVIAYVGTPGRLDRVSPDERVVEQVGADSLDRLPAVKSIVDEVYSADPPLHDFPTLAEMDDAVADFLQTRHPELSDDAVRAVANRFTYDWK